MFFEPAPVFGKERPVWVGPPVRERRPARRQPPARFPALCAASCRHGAPRPTGGRAHVCPPCEEAAVEALRAIGRVWPDLQARLVGERPVWRTERVKAEGAVGLNLSQAVLDVSLDVEELVAWWCQTVRDEAGVPAPAGGVPVLVEWLARWHVSWFGSHPDRALATGFVDDCREFASRVAAVAYPKDTRVVHVPRRCHARAPVDASVEALPDGSWPEGAMLVQCPGRLTARIHPDLAQYPDLVCDLNPGHVVPPSIWSRWPRHGGTGLQGERKVEAMREAIDRDVRDLRAREAVP